jgi:preprotein translocase subunit YajC
MATEKTIKLKVENGEAIIRVDELNKALKQTNKEADDLNDTVEAGTEALDKFTKGGVSAMKGLISGAKTAIGAMTSLKGAVISTGIGALVVIVASLAAYFTRTSRGADALAVIMGGLGAVIDKITQVAITLGETLFKAFQNPKKALADFGTALKTNITNRLEGLLEFIPAVAKAIGLALKGNFKEAGAVATDAVAKVGLGVENMTEKLGAAVDGAVNFGKSLTEAARKGMELAEALDAVEDRERDLIVLRAKSNKEIAKARMIADDTTKSTEERIAAVQRAFKLEQKVANAEQANARAYLKYLDEKIKTETSNDDDLKARAEAAAKVLELETESLRRQKRLQTEVTSLKNEDKVALEAGIKLREEAAKKELEYQAFIKNGERETIELINKTNAARVVALTEFNNQVSKLRGVGQTDREKELAQIKADGISAMRALIESGQATADKAVLITTAQREAELKVNRKYDQLEQARQRASAAQKLELLAQSFGALAQLSEALSKGDEKNAEKSFKITKALRLGEAVANTAAGIMGQLAVPYDQLTGANFVKAGIIAVTGAAQIATIAKTKFTPGTSTAEKPTVGSAPSGGGGGFTPNISFTGIGQNPFGGMFGQPMQAYVVGQQMNNANMLERRIRTSATFGG